MATRSADSVPISPVVAIRPELIVSADVRETAARLGVLQFLPQVIDLTREIYGGFMNVTVLVDPELPEDTNIVFRVPVSCSIEESLEMDEEWMRRLDEIIPQGPRVYLAFTDFQ